MASLCEGAKRPLMERGPVPVLQQGQVLGRSFRTIRWRNQFVTEGIVSSCTPGPSPLLSAYIFHTLAGIYIAFPRAPTRSHSLTRSSFPLKPAGFFFTSRIHTLPVSVVG